MNDLWKYLDENELCLNSSNIPNSMKCFLCLKIMKNAVVTNCGCGFCSECIRSYLGDKTTNCPSCLVDEIKHKINFEDHVSKDIKSRKNISNITVSCLYQGCGETRELRNLYRHLKRCNFVEDESHELTCYDEFSNAEILNQLTDTEKMAVRLSNLVQNTGAMCSRVKESERQNSSTQAQMLAMEEAMTALKLEMTESKETFKKDREYFCAEVVAIKKVAEKNSSDLVSIKQSLVTEIEDISRFGRRSRTPTVSPTIRSEDNKLRPKNKISDSSILQTSGRRNESPNERKLVPFGTHLSGNQLSSTPKEPMKHLFPPESDKNTDIFAKQQQRGSGSLVECAEERFSKINPQKFDFFLEQSKVSRPISQNSQKENMFCEMERKERHSKTMEPFSNSFANKQNLPLGSSKNPKVLSIERTPNTSDFFVNKSERTPQTGDSNSAKPHMNSFFVKHKEVIRDFSAENVSDTLRRSYFNNVDRVKPQSKLLGESNERIDVFKSNEENPSQTKSRAINKQLSPTESTSKQLIKRPSTLFENNSSFFVNKATDVGTNSSNYFAKRPSEPSQAVSKSTLKSSQSSVCFGFQMLSSMNNAQAPKNQTLGKLIQAPHQGFGSLKQPKQKQEQPQKVLISQHEKEADVCEWKTIQLSESKCNQWQRSETFSLRGVRLFIRARSLRNQGKLDLDIWREPAGSLHRQIMLQLCLGSKVLSIVTLPIGPGPTKKTGVTVTGEVRATLQPADASAVIVRVKLF